MHCETTLRQMGSSERQKKAKPNIKFVIAPQVDTATSGALRYMARTRQRRTYLPLAFPSRTHLPTPRGLRVESRSPRYIKPNVSRTPWLSKPRPEVQRATGPRLLICYATACSQRHSNQRPRGRWSSALTTRRSRHPWELMHV